MCQADSNSCESRQFLREYATVPQKPQDLDKYDGPTRQKTGEGKEGGTFNHENTSSSGHMVDLDYSAQKLFLICRCLMTFQTAPAWRHQHGIQSKGMHDTSPLWAGIRFSTCEQGIATISSNTMPQHRMLLPYSTKAALSPQPQALTKSVALYTGFRKVQEGS